MKILTVCIVCKEENNTLDKLIESCLLLKEDIEVLILGQDTMLRICEAKEYEKENPRDIRVYTSTKYDFLQVGIEKANGLYFKIVDGNDKIDTSVLVKVVETCKDLLRIQANLDMMICDYEYALRKKKNRTIGYSNVFPLDKVFQWHQTKSFQTMQKITMKAIIIKTNILKRIDFTAFNNPYIEELLVLKILPYIKSMLYLNKSLLVINSNKQRNVSIQGYNKLIKNIITTIDITNTESRKLRNCIINHLNSLLVYSGHLYFKQDAKQAEIMKKEIIEYIMTENPNLYRGLKKTTSFKLYSSNIKLSELLIARKTKRLI